ncbi:SDR family NAD(P)-dependent oxidoreductase [Leifsonia aquatica]|uniref:SDR family NAD(P)-dependent oxidoreductase n=1 Tax=Leifsonia aquatica TaxID=144185 RepID=UPI00385154C7
MTQHSIDRLAGRSVVLIGGGSGIGLAVARQAVAAGARVHLGGRTETTLQRAAAELGDAASWGVVDTSDDASVARFFERVEAVAALLTTAASYTTGRSRPPRSRRPGARSSRNSGASTGSSTPPSPS